MSPKPERPRSAHTAEGGIILDIAHGRMFSLNSSGSKIFQLLERGVPEDRIVEDLVKQFGVSADVAKVDLTDFCRSLQSYALLTTDLNSPSE